MFIWGWPLSISESSDTVLILFYLKKSNGRPLAVTHSMEVFCLPTISWSSVAKNCLEFILPHDLFQVCFFFIIGAQWFIENRFIFWLYNFWLSLRGFLRSLTLCFFNIFKRVVKFLDLRLVPLLKAFQFLDCFGVEFFYLSCMLLLKSAILSLHVIELLLKSFPR